MTTPILHPQASAIPLACVPGAIPAAERAAHFELLTRLKAERTQLWSRATAGLNPATAAA